MKFKNIDFYDEDVTEAFILTIDFFGKEVNFDFRPSDEGFNIYDDNGSLIQQLKEIKNEI